MPQNNLPLYTVVPKEEYDLIIPGFSHRKGEREVKVSLLQHTVGLHIGDIYYAQQFGNAEQAIGKFKELKEKIRTGGML